MIAIEALAHHPDPAPLFAALRDLPHPVWLDSGRPGSSRGRYDLISAAPTQVLSAEPGAVQARLREAGGLLDALSSAVRSGADAHDLPFVGGLIGWLGYPAGTELLGLPARPAEPLPWPLLLLQIGCYVWAAIVDHRAERTLLAFHPSCPSALRREVRARCRHAPAGIRPEADFRLESSFRATTPKPRFASDIARILAYLRAGDCYQVNYAQHFSARCQGDPWQAYLRLRELLPSPYSAYLEWPGHAVLSLSPEQFLGVQGDRVQTRPIKGTAPRGASAGEDAALAAALRSSAKDRAENLMIVDLLRNDLGKSCVPGSIAVPELFALESFANVHHLVSTVTGRLRHDQTPLDLLANCFPGGSVTGAPKRRAMEIIAELEPVGRSLYCGSLFYLSANGRMDSNITIRTLLVADGEIHCWGGGGIVADSSAESEYRESRLKIELLMQGLGGPAVDPGRPPSRDWSNR
ncbi:MAG TPA: aminodeoxychorismate synthase component I [Porticoccaceae bacterium]|nr:aminodeoxychorismate synthase component I [Porticoccaceae bacterium]